MINVKTKIKSRSKTKRVRKASSNDVPRRPVGYFELTPEDIAEMNMFGEAIAKMNVAAAARRRAEAKPEGQGMRQWDIVEYPFAHPIGLHPAIIFSPDNVLANPDVAVLIVLIVTTVRADYGPGRLDVMLNGADGLDHLSRTRVVPIFQVERANIGRRIGALSTVRQKAVARKIKEIYRLD